MTFQAASNPLGGFVLYAPNVHVGGGIALLKAILVGWPQHVPCVAFLDERARAELTPPKAWTVTWCRRTPWGLIKAERALRRASLPGSVVFMFQSLPPLFAGAGKVICYVHNAYVISRRLGSDTGWRRLRIEFERAVFAAFHRRISRFLVQTPTMARMLEGALKTLGHTDPHIEVAPFMDRSELPAPRRGAGEESYDFAYVSDGSPHKNHVRLFEAWAELAKEGFRPSLAITVAEDSASLSVLSRLKAEQALEIDNLGPLSRQQVTALYANSRAIMFPSIEETLGLPLVEARAADLPILASERDFVWDVCCPVQTFDPMSSVSIARAVRRHLGEPDTPLVMLDPATFCEYLLGRAVGNAPGRTMGDQSLV